jgi:hypothetical protein
MLIITSPAFAADRENLILKRPYSYWPEPKYHDSHDDGDITQLTDGFTEYRPSMWMNKSCVGWAAGVDIPVVMHFDLGEESTIHELRFNTAGGGGAGVVEVGLRVYVSLDDKTYTYTAEHQAPPPPAEGKATRTAMQIKLPLGGARARYVAISAMAPPPHYFVFVDEIEILGNRPADPISSLPVQTAIHATGAKGIQELLSGRKLAGNLMAYLTGPVERHIESWPANEADAQLDELRTARERASLESGSYDQIRAELTPSHRDRARRVYGGDTLVWETEPDDAATMLSMPTTLRPANTATVHTVVNALEATALGAANLTDTAQPLAVSIAGEHAGGPVVTPRVARFFQTTNMRYAPDALILTDGPNSIPSGESKLIWIGVESTGAMPGAYDYQVTVEIGDAAHQVALTVHVHDVTLSRETPIWTGNWSDLNTGEHPIFPLVRQTMLEHRITIGAGTSYPLPKKNEDGTVVRPVELDFTNMDKMLEFHKEFPRMTIFVAFDPHVDRPARGWFGPAEWMSDEFKEIFGEWLTGVIGRFKAKGRGYDQFAIMFFDENMGEKVVQTCQLAHEVDPNLKTMLTHPQASISSTKRFVDAGMNIFAHHAVRTGYDNAPDGYPMILSAGRELWFYSAADAKFGVGKERDPLGFYRHLHWTAFHHGATGAHFWNMLHNNGRSPVWGPEPPGTYWPMVYPIGEGYPDLPEDVQTEEKVIPSRRWEYTRMGIEDYMLLKMARDRIEELGDAARSQKQRLDEIVKTAIVNRDQDRTLFRAKRKELVLLVEELMAL